MRCLTAFIGMLLVTHVVGAHTFPDQRAEREITVHLSDVMIRVHYKLEINVLTMAIEGNQIFRKEDYPSIRGPQDLARIYADRKAPFLADNLDAMLNDGGRLDWITRGELLQITPENEQQYILQFVFEAPWTLPVGEMMRLRFEDRTFTTSDGSDTFPGKIALKIADTSPGLIVHDRDDPRRLHGKSPLELTPKEKQELRLAQAEFTRTELTPATPMVEEPPATPPAKPGLVAGLWRNGLASLFDSDAGIGLLLLAALIFGAGHALTPGHGKTLVAAYLVGERGTLRHALVLGLATTIAHTGSVIVLACVLWWSYGSRVPQSAQGWLQAAGGMLIFFVGLWLLMRRVAGKADHVHFGAGHHHHHGPHEHHEHHEHHHHEPPPQSGWLRVVLLGIGGGLVPCWDAVMLLFLAISFGRLAFAVPLLIAFSVGLAAVLVMLGMAVVMAHRAGGKKFGERKWFQRLPVLSAGLLVVIGIWLARDGVQMLMPAPTTNLKTEN